MALVRCILALKNPTASVGFELATSVLKASSLPLDHRSRQSGDVQQELFLHFLAFEGGTENLSRSFGNKLPTSRNNNPKQRRIKLPDTLRLICKTEQVKSFRSCNSNFIVFFDDMPRMANMGGDPTNVWLSQKYRYVERC
jgi:hypothetical protein